MGTLRPRQAWGIGVLVACVGLLALVAVAADGAPLRAPDDSPDTELSARLFAAVQVVLLVGGACMLVVLLIALASSRNPRPRGVGRRSLARTIVMFAALCLLTGALLPLRRDHQNEEPPLSAGTPSTTVVERANGRPSPTWPVVVLVGAVVMSLGAAAWMARRRRPQLAFDDIAPVVDEQRRQASSAFDASLTDLEAEPDPRAAIIAAYARLLDGLEQCGLARRAAEAPEEHLHRALETLRVPPAPLQTLVALFGEARFSEHVLTTADKATAIDAFRVARDDLAGLVRR